MKAKLIYLNLGIDLLWGKGNLHENVFPMRSPFLPRLARSLENLGLYWSDSSDSLVISKEKLPESFFDVLQSYGIDRPRFLWVAVDPIEKAKFVSDMCSQLRFLFLDYAENEAEEKTTEKTTEKTNEKVDVESAKESVVGSVAQQVPADDPLLLASRYFSGFLAASISEVEETLINRLHLTLQHPLLAGSGGDTVQIVQWNEKKFLVDWCREQGILFPETVVVGARDLKSERTKRSGVWIAKPNLSSGGAGAWVINDPRDVILGRLDAFAQRPNVVSDVWLLQKYYSRAKDWAIVGELTSVSGQVRLEPMRAVEVRYDRSRYSYAHWFSQKFSGDSLQEQELQRVYAQVADLLRQKGYQGCFGFDAFLSESGEFFPIVDLNVRLTKTHLLQRALSKVLQQNTGQVLRWRSLHTNAPSFSVFWKALRDEFAEYEKDDLAPILVSGFSCEEKMAETGPVEIHLAVKNQVSEEDFYQRVTRAFETSLLQENP